MAKILSQIDSIRRGSVGGITYSANQWHQIIARARTAPVDPSTVNQGIIRSAMSFISSLWTNLSDEQRTAWDNYAETCVYSGPLGQYTITGRLMAMAALILPMYCNSRELIELVASAIPPVLPGFFTPGPINVIPYAGDPGIGIGLSIGNTTGEDGVAFVERSFAFNPSRNRFKGPFLSGPAQAVDLPDETSAALYFTGLAKDFVYFTYVRTFTKVAPFRISASYIFRHVANEVTI